jgi:hypothetical protein
LATPALNTNANADPIVVPPSPPAVRARPARRSLLDTVRGLLDEERAKLKEYYWNVFLFQLILIFGMISFLLVLWITETELQRVLAFLGDIAYGMAPEMDCAVKAGTDMGEVVKAACMNYSCVNENRWGLRGETGV